MKSVLIVDDDNRVRESLKAILEEKEYRTFGAATGEVALKLAESHFPDLILLDIDMPGRDGIQVLRALKADRVLEQIPVIMVTSNHARETVVAAAKAGAVDYLVKPVTREKLQLKVRRALVIGELEREGRKARAREQVSVFRQSGVTIVVFTSLIDWNTAQEVDRIFTPTFRAQGRANELVFDLRYQSGLTREQLAIIKKVSDEVSNRPVRYLAGRNYGAMLGIPLDTENQLFISEEDLEAYLNLPLNFPRTF